MIGAEGVNCLLIKRCRFYQNAIPFKQIMYKQCVAVVGLRPRLSQAMRSQALSLGPLGQIALAWVPTFVSVAALNVKDIGRK